MKYNNLTLTIFLIVGMTSCEMKGLSGLEEILPFKTEDCLNISMELLEPVKEIVTDSFYKTSQLKNYESLEIDSMSNAILTVNYRFKAKDSVSSFFMFIGTTITFEKSEIAAREALDLWEERYNKGLQKTLRKNITLQTRNLDSLISFGETSSFIEYKVEGRLLGYKLTGQINNIAYMHAIVSNHIIHHKHIDILRTKIDKLKNFAATQEIQKQAITAHWSKPG